MDIDPTELSSGQHKTLKRFVRLITDRIHVRYLFCFAMQRRQSAVVHCLAPYTQRSRIDVDLLLVCADMKELSVCQVQALANNLGNEDYQYHISVVLHQTEATRLLEAGDPFLCTVFSKGALLYGHDDLSEARRGYMCYRTRLQHIRNGWHRWFGKSCQFMDCAAYCLVERRYGMAVFMVHQTIEQACKAMIKVLLHTGANTHNLAWMLKLCGHVIPEVTTIFPRNSPEEKKLFELLKGSYIDWRYAEDFEVAEEQARELCNRAGILLKTIGEWSNNHIRTIEQYTQ